MLHRYFLIALAVVLEATQPALGQAPTDASARQREFQAAFMEGLKAGTRGGSDLPLLDQAMLRLPANYIFVPQPQAGRIMRALGNSEGESLVGLVLPASEEQSWLAVINFIKSGYVKDEEAKDWKADSLLQDLREGTEEANEDRVARGFDPIEVVGWSEAPAYDASTHRLVWAALNRVKNAGDSPLGVNYNTYALGREGYFTLNLLTDADRLNVNRVHSLNLLAALNYKEGKAYHDFKAGTDKVAAYGITALVAGVAAKKLGILALVGAFLAKGAKVLVIAAGAALLGLKRFFSRRNPPSV